MKEKLKRCIQVAMGKTPADILFVNGHVVSTFTEEILDTELAVCNGKIAALGHVHEAKETIDLKGAYICPSLIDPHIHIESSMLTPEGFAEAIVPHGTGSVVSDPHEITNVLGLQGIEYMVKASAHLPIDILYGIPSCVPATHMETSGGKITAEDIAEALRINPSAPVLSEMMNYPGVFLENEDVLEKICTAHRLGLKIDGHSPLLSGKELNAYMNADIFTDHECTTVEEAMEKLRRGMYILMRDGTACQNLEDLFPLLSEHTMHRICIACDDRHPDHLQEGHLDATWRKLIKWGLDPIRALRILSLNPALCYELKGRGALGIGYEANFFIVEDIKNPIVKTVYYKGKKVAENGKLLQSLLRVDAQEAISSIHLPVDLEEKLESFPQEGKVRVIGVVEGQIVTEHLIDDAEKVKTQEDIVFLAVVERHGKNGQVGLGFLKGFGLKSGALASTVAHDHHNLILAGKNIDDLKIAARTIEKIGGGFVVVDQGEVKASVPLPIAGIMSQEPVENIVQDLQKLDQAAREIGSKLKSPFMTLSFLALSVIPSLKLTDMGLVDVEKFEIVPLLV